MDSKIITFTELSKDCKYRKYDYDYTEYRCTHRTNSGGPCISDNCHTWEWLDDYTPKEE
jgi:hypothetical protein